MFICLSTDFCTPWRRRVLTQQTDDLYLVFCWKKRIADKGFIDHVSDAIQVVVVSGRAMYRVGSTSVRAAAAMIKLFNTISLSKWKGKTSLGHLRQIKGDDMVFINIASEEGRILSSTV